MEQYAPLFCLLKKALWGNCEAVITDVTQNRCILKEAERQAVTPLVLNAMDGCGVKLPEEVVADYLLCSLQVEQDNRKLNKAVSILDELLTKNGINYAIVKGQAVGSLYPTSLLRESGDIDFYCNREDIEKAKTVLQQSWRVELDAANSDHHLHFDYKGVTFELHYALESFYNNQKDNYWGRLIEGDKGCEVVIGGKPVKTLSPMLHTLYVFLHLYHHLMELGVGLRQFCDLAVMLHAYKSDVYKEDLRRHLKALDMEKAFCACGSILVYQLGLPAEDFPYMLTKRDQHYGKKILDVVLYRGNMGHYNKKSGFQGWRHNIESTGIKISHFVKFMPLAPAYSCRWLKHELGRKVRLKMKNENG